MGCGGVKDLEIHLILAKILKKMSFASEIQDGFVFKCFKWQKRVIGSEERLGGISYGGERMKRKEKNEVLKIYARHSATTLNSMASRC